MSLTFTLSGKESILSADFSPPLNLGDNNFRGVGNGSEWVIRLVDFQTCNSIPNVVEGKNKLYYYDGEILKFIHIEIDDLNDYLRSVVGDPDHHDDCRNQQNGWNVKFKFSLQPNLNTLKCEILCSVKLDFTKEDSIGQFLGFGKRILEANKLHESDDIVNIMKVNSIQIDCNISSGSFRNNSQAHILHVFFPTAPPGYKIIEVPTNVIYLPVNVRIIDNIKIRVIDQQGDIIDFRGETITVRLHLKKIGDGN